MVSKDLVLVLGNIRVRLKEKIVYEIHVVHKGADTFLQNINDNKCAVHHRTANVSSFYCEFDSRR